MANKAWHKFYGRRWRIRRALQLDKQPLCVMCKADGRITPATVADHITPHKGDPLLFAGPLQSLCKACHDSRKQSEEKQAENTPTPCGVDGYPVGGDW